MTRLSDISREIVINFTAVPVAKAKNDKNLVLGWAMVSVEEDGKFYTDTQGTYLSQKLVFDSAVDFMLHSRKSDDMHDERQRGVVVMAWPFLDGLSDEFALPAAKRGFAIGVSFDDVTFKKYESGEYTGFSAGGTATAKLLAPGSCPECELPSAVCTCSPSDHQNVRKSAELGGHPHKYVTFQMDWISAVTRPAQKGAQSLVVAKRDDSTPVSTPSENRTMELPAALLLIDVQKKRLDDIGTLTGPQFEVFKGMTSDGQSRFLSLSSGERDAAVQAAEAADPVVIEYEGQKVRKSAGPGIIAALTAAKANQAQLQEQIAVNKAAVYKARVPEINHLALDETSGIELLVAVDTIKNEPIREKVMTALKAFSNHNAGAGKTHGVSGGSVTPVRKSGASVGLSAGAIYTQAVKKYADEQKISMSTAYASFPASSDEARQLLKDHEDEKKQIERS